MNSLRGRLIAWLWLALIIVGVGFSAYTYWQQRREADVLLDYQMEQIAGFVAASSITSAKPQSLMPQLPLSHDADDDLLVTVRAGADRILYSSQPQAPLPAVSRVGFQTITLNGRSYRLYSGRSGDCQILVAQQMEARREVGRNAVAAAVEPLLALIPLLGLISALVIRRQLVPLNETAQEIARRPALALAPLPTAGMPGEVRPLVDEINRLMARLRDAVDHERRFIADAAHALRTPLAALQLQVDVLEGATDSRQRAERFSELRAGIRRTTRLAHHLLALARSESVAGTKEVRTEVDSALSDIADTYRTMASTRRVILMLFAHADAAVALEAQQLSLVIGNLLDNALRYTAPDSVVTLRARSDDECVIIEVLDQGTGLPEAELGKVATRFYRAQGDRTEGSGLGLAIVKKIVESAGGGMTIENRTDGLGLCVRLRLPRTRPARKQFGDGATRN